MLMSLILRTAAPKGVNIRLKRFITFFV